MLTYDRLGVGKSSKPDGHNVVQGPVEVEILKEITMLAREGKLAQFIASDEKLFVPDFEKIVLVGHSMGSAFTIGALAEYGDIADGAVATGMIPQGKLTLTGQSAYGLVYAASNDPVRFGDRGSGYLVQGAQTDANKLFFKKGFFEPELLAYGTEIKQTGTVGEFMSMGATLMKPAPGYTGPILVCSFPHNFPQKYLIFLSHDLGLMLLLSSLLWPSLTFRLVLGIAPARMIWIRSSPSRFLARLT